MRIFMSPIAFKASCSDSAWKKAIPIEAKMVSRRRSSVPKRQVEGRNFEVRKHLLEYDDVMNKQREEIYKLRRDILEGNVRGASTSSRSSAKDMVGMTWSTRHCPERARPARTGSIDRGPDFRNAGTYFNIETSEATSTSISKSSGIDELSRAVSEQRCREAATSDQVADVNGGEADRAAWNATFSCGYGRRRPGKTTSWPWIISRKASGCVGTASATPRTSTSAKATSCSQAMKERIEETSILKTLFRVEPMTEERAGQQIQERRQRHGALGDELRRNRKPSAPRLRPAVHLPTSATGRTTTGTKASDRGSLTEPKVGRNEPCPCGSGKKYKKCHGRSAA